MDASWRLLVVDDEADIHDITNLTLKNRRLDGRPFRIDSAHSAQEARKLISENRDGWHVGLIDVVMEEDDAGLSLCRHIRASCPRWMRIVLRTGQPGAAPEEDVLREYDIDYYLAKSEATAHNLYAITRCCIRMSQEVTTLWALQKQLRDLTSVLVRSASTVELLEILDEALIYLQHKHGAQIIFFPRAGLGEEEGGYRARTAVRGALPRSEEEIIATVQKGYEQRLTPAVLHDASKLGLSDTEFVMLPAARVGLLMSLNPEIGHDDRGVGAANDRGGLYVRMNKEQVRPKTLINFAADLNAFLDNWAVGYGAYQLRKRAG